MVQEQITESADVGEESWGDLLLTCWKRTEEIRTEHQDEFLSDGTEATLFALALAVEQRDSHTGGHCERMAFICVAMGIVAGLEQADLVALYRGAYLHDVGKVGIPDNILFKPGRLTAEEWVVMRSHAIRGEEICRHLKTLEPVLPIIRHHHERWNGTGYPDGRAGENIPLLARIVQIADCYDALISVRPYKPAYSVNQALGVLDAETERGWHDPKLMQMFHRLHFEVIANMKSRGPDRTLQTIRRSLVNLQHALAAEASALVS